MERRNACTSALVFVAVTVLAFEYGVVSLDKLSVNPPFISIEVSSPNNLFLPVLAVALLGGLLIYHVATHRYDILREYRDGYRFAPKLVEGARSLVIEASRGTHRDPAVGNIHATLRRGTYDLGQWSRPDGSLSQRMEFTPDPATHRHAVMRGFAHALGPKMWLPFYAPVLLGLWALTSMALAS